MGRTSGLFHQRTLYYFKNIVTMMALASLRNRELPHPGPRGKISFLHPAYPAPTNTLLSLIRVDRSEGSPALGIHHRTALLACQIIANNTFNTGRFTYDQEAIHEVDVPLDGVLTESVYYFVVGDGQNRYPIVPSFQEWEFPHGQIPEFWPKLPLASRTGPRCCVTKFSFYVEETHLVPQEEATWYTRNGMSQYGWELGDIDNAANTIPLTPSIHRCFDKRWLVLIPKPSNTEAGGTPPTEFVTHILSESAAELWCDYHNSIVGDLDEHSRPYLFARFGWAVLLGVKPFITCGLPRNVIQLHTSTDASGEVERQEYKDEILRGAELLSKYGGGGGGSKGATPGKRRSEASNADGDSVIEYSSDDSDTWDDYWDDDMMDIWERIGGKRKQRQTSNQTDPHMWLGNDQHLPQDANKSCVPPEQQGGQTFTQDNDMH
ncbi:hypothetical protein FQN52_001122 [Onygenales sp. PD_12]|nr:hypothetical protein FQN52_001122 [Onygenales sp. PD_12]